MSCQPHRVTSGQSNSAISKVCTCQNCVTPFSSQDKQTLSSINIHLELFLTILMLNQQAQHAHGVNTRFSGCPQIKTLALTQCLANYFCQQTNLPTVKAELYQNSLALVTTPTQYLLPNLTLSSSDSHHSSAPPIMASHSHTEIIASAKFAWGFRLY